MALTPETSDSAVTMDSNRFIQEPIAVVGMACRLPGHSDSPRKLWEFLMHNGVADTEVPPSRFNMKGFYEGSDRPRTMRSPGAMFMETVDPAAFDAPFFNISPQEAIAMDPQQRILLEIIYEGLENAGIPMESLSGEKYGCFVGAHTGDYWDIFSRDPDSRPPNAGIGGSATMLSNRVSHFLDIKGPSLPIDTACSSSLVALDTACKSLHIGEINGAIVAAAGLILNPEYGCDAGSIKNTHSPTGRCHTFDAKADGYVKAEGINVVILKRLEDALHDRDPIRAVIRGSANNHNGRTAGIASPNADVQADALRQAYLNANITDYSLTGYLECHGTGTTAGDPVETTGVASVFAASRPIDRPLRIGSIKSNIGHSESAAGLSGLMKGVMILETGMIPGNPTFETPNPDIDFHGLRLDVRQNATPFPDMPFRRVSVNCFGFGGSNAHVILDEPQALVEHATYGHSSSYRVFEDLESSLGVQSATRPYLLPFSANKEKSLRDYVENISEHLNSPAVNVQQRDLTYTLGVRRSQLFHRGFAVINPSSILDPTTVVYGKKHIHPPKIGFVFTGQGAQWPEMGRELLQTFASAREAVGNLDAVLQRMASPPSWSLFDELTQPRSPDLARQPEFSQPLVTALQIALVAVLRSWGISPHSVVGHSSGEIAASYAAGLLTEEEAILVAYYRGRTCQDARQSSETDLGMLAVGVGADDIAPYLREWSGIEIACYNSPASVTLSGIVSALQQLLNKLVDDGVFARMLHVDLAYHSTYMDEIGAIYERRLNEGLAEIPRHPLSSTRATMYSSVSGNMKDDVPDSAYWRENMTSPVRFDDAFRAMLTANDSPNFLVEIGPSGALKGPITQIQKVLGGHESNVTYHAALHRGTEAIHSTLKVAGHLFLAGAPVCMEQVNEDSYTSPPSVIIDLPNYSWDHSTKYWFESTASRDWRFKPFIHHDLLGSKIIGTSWRNPTFKKAMNLSHLAWLRDHRIGSDVVFPASAYISMAVEALYQVSCMREPDTAVSSPSELGYRLRNLRFDMALILEDGMEPDVYLTMNPFPGSKDNWHEFHVSSTREESTTQHASGMIRIQEPVVDPAPAADISPLEHPLPGHMWTKGFAEIGFNYGPAFHLLQAVEARAGQRRSRCLITLADPQSDDKPQSSYPFHPAALDGVFRSTVPGATEGQRSRISETLIPAMIDDLIINPNCHRPNVGIAVSSSYYSGRGRKEKAKSHLGDSSVYDPSTGALLIRMSRLASHEVDLGIDPLAAHTLTQDVMKPDITTLTQDSIQKLHRHYDDMVFGVLELAVHKKPSLNVLEVDLDTGDIGSSWLNRKRKASDGEYRFMALDPVTIADIQNQYEDQDSELFHVLDPESDRLGVEENVVFDLIIVKVMSPLSKQASLVIEAARKLLSNEANLLAIDYSSTGRQMSPKRSLSSKLENLEFAKILSVPDCRATTFLCAPSKSTEKGRTTDQLHVVSFEGNTHIPPSMLKPLEQGGWQVTAHECPAEDVPEKATVLVMDEILSPVLTHISESQWLCLRRLITSGCKILWVTQGAQFTVTQPDNALASGLFRSVRSEDPAATVMTLDIESDDVDTIAPHILTVLGQLKKDQARWITDVEYVERNGILHIPRVMPYAPLDREAKTQAGKSIPKILSKNSAMTQLRAERVGTLDALQFVEVSDSSLPEGHVEIEIHAVGLNFKDVAVTMGIVPENEHLLGLEGSGVIRGIGPGVDANIQLDSRVVFMAKGAIANRVHVPVGLTHKIPDKISHHAAATMPVVFCTALYSLFDAGGLRAGQTVLIHSAAGGVGLACIQLAQYAGAEIYVTVGMEEKRRHLHEEFGIAYERMFSSRSTEFASDIMKATGGLGIDVIINSLTGDLLDATWRICADGGTMVELGKRDIVERNYLAMDPFDRGCTYRAVDLSHPRLLRKLPSIMKRVFDLESAGHIRPITPTTTFSMGQIPEAFAYLRSGRHIGKIVLADKPGETSEVSVRPLQQDISFQKELSYLIVGGLRGLCGSLAVHLAKRGARHLVVMARSGCDDSRSQAVVWHCQSLGCDVHVCRGDVLRVLDVRRAFMKAPAPIGGIIQGAMLLRDRPYETMTVQEYHEAIEAKIQGTWNLHHVSMEKGLSLDFFLLLSSISSVVGSKGQANYAAANSFLDSFAAYRRSMGLAAQTVNLGVVEDVGVVAESEALTQRHQGSSELTSISEGILHTIVNCSLRQQSVSATLCRDASQVDHASSPSRLITGLAVPQDPEQSGLRFDPRFRGLFVARDSPRGSSSGDKTDSLSNAVKAFHALLRSGAANEQLVEPCLHILATRLGQMLRWSAEQQIEPERPLSVYGLDSLSTIELRNWVKVEMGAELTTFDIINANSLIMLGERLVNKLRRG